MKGGNVMSRFVTAGLIGCLILMFSTTLALAVCVLENAGISLAAHGGDGGGGHGGDGGGHGGGDGSGGSGVGDGPGTGAGTGPGHSDVGPGTGTGHGHQGDMDHTGTKPDSHSGQASGHMHHGQ